MFNYVCEANMSGSINSFCVQWAKFFKVLDGSGSHLFKLMLNS